jgi:nucleotide-binding universal stress UspA family protein
MSAAANAALSYTTRLAEQLHGRLVLLHVYLTLDPLMEPEAVLMASSVELASRKQIRANLQRLASELPVPAEAELSVDTLATAVAAAEERHQPLLLALGREASHSLLDRLIAHRTAPTVQTTQYPMLLVPENWTKTELPRRVMVAADGQSFTLAPHALALKELLHALQPTVSVVHVAPHAHGPSHADMALEAVRATAMFGAITNNSLYEVREEAPAEGLLHAADELNADLIVVLARPHTFLGGLFHRSVTARVLRQSPVPVLVLPTTA